MEQVQFPIIYAGVKLRWNRNSIKIRAELCSYASTVKLEESREITKRRVK